MAADGWRQCCEATCCDDILSMERQLDAILSESFGFMRGPDDSETEFLHFPHTMGGRARMRLLIYG